MRLAATALLGLFAALAGGSPAPAQEKKAANKPVSFSKDVMPIFNNYCVSCHDPKMKKAGLDMTSYATSAKGSKGGKLWAAGNPAKSLLIIEISGDKPKMPSKGQTVSKDEIDTLSRWIKEGCQNN